MSAFSDDLERRSAPAAERNREAITRALADWLPPQGAVLEVASGTGQHVAHWAAHFPALDWQPSDGDPAALASIDAWRREAARANLAPALQLDVGDPGWPAAAPGPWRAIVVVNLLHISPWSTTLALFAGAARTLAPDGRLLIYGAFAEAGVLVPESNVAFDAWLRRENPAWGVRDLDDLRAAAAAHGMALGAWVEMPANNRLLVIERTPAT